MLRLLINELIALGQIIVFSLKKARHYAIRRKRNIQQDVQIYINELKEYGVIVIPGFLSHEKCAEILRNIPDEKEFMVSPEGDKSRFYLNADKLSILSDYFNDSRLAGIMKGYIGDKAIPFRQNIEIREHQGVVPAFDRMYHIDTWKYRLKGFLYLHDVNEEDAPLTYLKKSHRGLWRLPIEAKMNYLYKTDKLGYASGLDNAYLGCCWPYESSRIKQEYGLEEKICTAQAGSLVLFDARGLHKATDLVNPHRKILISYWIERGHHI